MQLTRAFAFVIISLAHATLPVCAQELGETVSQPGLFSYQAPKGWTVKETSFSKYKVCFDTPKNKFAPNINVLMETYPKSLAEYVELNKTNLKAIPMFKNLQFVEEKPFEGAAGIKGIRLVIKDTLSDMNLQQVFYFFEGSANAKWVATGSSLVGDGSHYAPIFDASMKTFSPN